VEDTKRELIRMALSDEDLHANRSQNTSQVDERPVDSEGELKFFAPALNKV